MRKKKLDHRVYAELNRLIELKAYVTNTRLLPKCIAWNALSGQHQSRLRGRGLSFEELRAYQIGDDIRTLDWKVSNRTKKPHVRVYSEERERNVVLLADQRSHMFFGSQVNMKSVTAAEIAALSMWRVLSNKDRIGALVFNDQHIKQVRPQRRRNTAMQILHHVLSMNHQLSARPSTQNSAQLNYVLAEAERLCGHDYLVLLISDMDGYDEQSLKRIKRISAHNDVIVSLIVDPLEQSLPDYPDLVVSDGELQIQVNSNEPTLKSQFSKEFSRRVSALETQLRQYRIAVQSINTVEPIQSQI